MPAQGVEAALAAARPDLTSAGAPFVVSWTDEVQCGVPMVKGVVVASGDLDARDVAWLADADLLIAADGGAASLVALGHRPDVVVGDLDSVDGELVERLAAAGTRVERQPSDKDASDTELALQVLLDAGATSIVLLGATGGRRPDHALANVLLLSDPTLARATVRLVHGASVARVLRGRGELVLDAAPGDVVSLLPMGGDAGGVTTTGLRWALAGATLHAGRSRGLSNEVLAAPASVQVERGVLLVVETSKLGGDE